MPPARPRVTARSLALLAALAALVLASCAILPHRRTLPGVPIEERPTPPQPADTVATAVEPVEESPTKNGSAPAPTVEHPNTAPPPPVQAVMSPEERKATLQRIVADTTAAAAAVEKCAGKSLLPDQESVFETTRSYLMQVRAAVTRGELWSAEGLARKARQLALSLDCR